MKRERTRPKVSCSTCKVVGKKGREVARPLIWHCEFQPYDTPFCPWVECPSCGRRWAWAPERGFYAFKESPSSPVLPVEAK